MNARIDLLVDENIVLRQDELTQSVDTIGLLHQDDVEKPGEGGWIEGYNSKLFLSKTGHFSQRTAIEKHSGGIYEFYLVIRLNG